MGQPFLNTCIGCLLLFVSSGVGAQTQEPPIPGVHGKGTLYIVGGAASFDRFKDFVTLVGAPVARR